MEWAIGWNLWIRENLIKNEVVRFVRGPEGEGAKAGELCGRFSGVAKSPSREGRGVVRDSLWRRRRRRGHAGTFLYKAFISSRDRYCYICYLKVSGRMSLKGVDSITIIIVVRERWRRWRCIFLDRLINTADGYFLFNYYFPNKCFIGFSIEFFM